MGLSLTISANKNSSLGTSREVTSLLARYFPGFKPVLETNRPVGPSPLTLLASFLGLKTQFTGPSTAKLNVAHVQDAGYTIEFQYDEGNVVAALYLTLYGDTAAADRALAMICRDLDWKKTY